jgi:hypothetical protein
MLNDEPNTGFQSVLAPFMHQFLQEKHACGYAYRESIRMLHRLDDFLAREGLSTLELPRSVARNWLAKKPHESASTQQSRISSRRSCCERGIPPTCPTPHGLLVIHRLSYPEC